MSEKISNIRNDRERHFASVFFDHDEWEHQPETIHFDGGRYTADFYDQRRKVYIEVVGTRQAFFVNRYKYMYLLQIRPDINLEFRSHEGRLLDLYRFSLCSDSHRYDYRSREERYLETGIMPEGYENVADCIQPFANFVISTNLMMGEIQKITGIPQYYARWLLNFSHKNPQAFLIKSQPAEKIRKFLQEWALHPYRFPARKGWATRLTKELLKMPCGPLEYYCPVHPTDSYFDDTPPDFGRGRRKPPGDKRPPAKVDPPTPSEVRS